MCSQVTSMGTLVLNFFKKKKKKNFFSAQWWLSKFAQMPGRQNTWENEVFFQFCL